MIYREAYNRINPAQIPDYTNEDLYSSRKYSREPSILSNLSLRNSFRFDDDDIELNSPLGVNQFYNTQQNFHINHQPTQSTRENSKIISDSFYIRQ